jgi:hypothetical protein
LKTNGIMNSTDLADKIGVKAGVALAALRKLCAAGKAMYDYDLQAFRWRELYPEFDLDKIDEAGLEERKGVELKRNNTVTIEEESIEDGRRQITATVHDKNSQTTTAEIDADGRVVYADCTCPHFRYHKLRQGPCRHMIAVALN